MEDITFTWNVTALKVSEGPDNLVGVLREVSWELTATRGDTSAVARGVEKLSLPDPSTFIPLPDLTSEQALLWAMDAIGPSGLGNIAQALRDELDAQAHPSTIIIPGQALEDFPTSP